MENDYQGDASFVQRLKDYFPDMVVYKDLNKNNFISSFKLPSFMRDFVLMRYQDEDGAVDVDGAVDFINSFLPKKEAWKSIKNKIVTEGENGFVHEPNDTEGYAADVRKLLTDPELLLKIRTKSAASAAAFDIRQTAEAYLDLFKEVCKN